MEKQHCRVRLRLLFKRRRVLTKEQRLDGLDRCWFLLRPDLSTVSDLACDITRAFHLQSTCPNGLLLSMDEFVLPPFASIDIFRDNDLIRVTKNEGHAMKAIQLLEDEEGMIQIEEGQTTLEKQPCVPCSPILAIEQFEKEAGGYQTDEEDDSRGKPEEPNALNSSPVKKATKKKKRKRNDPDPSSSKKRKHKSHDSENLTSPYEGGRAVTMENDPCHSSEENTRNVQVDGKSYNRCGTAEAANDLECNGSEEIICFSSEKRRKKRRQTNDQVLAIVVENAEAINQEEVPLHNGVDLRSKPNGICKSVNGNDANLDISASSNDIFTGTINTVSASERPECLQEKSQTIESETLANGEEKKVPSRSARRKQAKRRWLREAKLSASNFKKIPDNHKNRARVSDTITVTADSGDTENAVIPIVVRPGHIRFEHSDEDVADKNGGLHDKEMFNSRSAGTIEWNGTLDKKKGQKWGRVRTSSTWSNEKSFPQYEQINANAETKTITQQEDFEKLCHITDAPKAGDVVAYRLVELSSSWCPEVSSFRVGKVTSYDPVTTTCTLVPVPGYPILLDKADESEMLPEQSVYKDDGSLEIEFTSLVDVRLLDGVRSGMTGTARCRNESTEAGPSNIGTSSKERNPNSGESSTEKKEAEADLSALGNSGNEVRNPDSGEASTGMKEANGWETWEDIQRAIERRRAELQHQNCADKRQKNDQPVKPSWSYRALRGSALGPTISLLRANNAL